MPDSKIKKIDNCSGKQNLNKQYVSTTEKKMALCTEVFYGNGDFYAGLAYIKNQELYSPDVNMQWIIISPPNRLDVREKVAQVKDVIKTNIIIYDDWLSFSKVDTSDLDRIFIYPSNHYMTLLALKRLMALDIPIQYCLEYDGPEKQQHINVCRRLVPTLRTGISELGIFLKPTPSIAELRQLIEVNAQNMVCHLMNKDVATYFSYINMMNKGVINRATFENYCRITASITDTTKDVTIITNTPFIVIDKDLVKELEENYGFTSVTYETWGDMNDSSKKTVKYHSSKKETVKTERKLFFVNPFPMKNEVMVALMALSNEFIQVTGDQTVSEIIPMVKSGRAKFPFYQTLFWKVEFADNLLACMKQYCSDNGVLVTLFEKTLATDNLDVTKFAEIWLSLRKTLTNDSIRIYEYLEKERNLSRNFPLFMSITNNYSNDSKGSSLIPRLIACLIAKIPNEEAIDKVIQAILVIEDGAERKSIISSMIHFLQGNYTVLNEDFPVELVSQLLMMDSEKRLYAARFLRELLSLYTNIDELEWSPEILPSMSHLDSYLYKDLMKSVRDEIKESHGAPYTLEKFKARVKDMARFTSGTLFYNPEDVQHAILLSTHVWPDGLGDLAKFIGVYRHISTNWPSLKIYTIVQYSEHFQYKRAMLKIMRRIPYFSMRHCRIVKYCTDKKKALKAERGLYKIQQKHLGLILSIATPGKLIHKHFRSFYHQNIPYLELTETSSASFGTKDLLSKDSKHEVCVMGLDDTDVGLEISKPKGLSPFGLIKGLTDSLSHTLMGSVEITEETVQDFVKNTVFAPLYIRKDQGLAVLFAIMMLSQQRGDKSMISVWLPELNIDLQSTTVLDMLSKWGIAKVDVYINDVDYQVVVDETKAVTLRILSGFIKKDDIDNLFELAQYISGIAGCCGPNSFEQSISFGLIPIYYPLNTGEDLLAQCVMLASRMGLSEQQIEMLMAYNDLLGKLRRFNGTFSYLKSLSAIFEWYAHNIHGIENVDTCRRAYEMIVAKIKVILGETVDISEILVHPYTLMINLLKTYDMKEVATIWQALSNNIKKQHSLLPWLDVKISQSFPQITPISALNKDVNQVKEEPIELLSVNDFLRVTEKDYPTLSFLMNNIIQRYWPSNADYPLQFSICNADNVVVNYLQGTDIPTIAINPKHTADLLYEQLRFAVCFAFTYILNNPVESDCSQLTQKHFNAALFAEMPEATICSKTTPNPGIDYFRYNHRILTEYQMTLVHESQAWYNIQNEIDYLAHAIKSLQLHLGRVNRHKISGEKISESEEIDVGIAEQAESEEIDTGNSAQAEISIADVDEPENSSVTKKSLVTDLTLARNNLNAYYVKKDQECTSINTLQCYIDTFPFSVDFNEYYHLSKRSKHHLKKLSDLKLEMSDIVKQKLHHLLSIAEQRKAPQYDELYRIVHAKLYPADDVKAHEAENDSGNKKGKKEKRLHPIGIFIPVQQAMDELAIAGTYEDALRLSKAIDKFINEDITKYYFCSKYTIRDFSENNPEYTAGNRQNKPIPLFSRLGLKIKWLFKPANFEQLLAWAKKDESKTIARVLSQLKYINEPRLWDLLPIKFYSNLINTDRLLCDEKIEKYALSEKVLAHHCKSQYKNFDNNGLLTREMIEEHIRLNLPMISCADKVETYSFTDALSSALETLAPHECENETNNTTLYNMFSKIYNEANQMANVDACINRDVRTLPPTKMQLVDALLKNIATIKNNSTAFDAVMCDVVSGFIEWIGSVATTCSIKEDLDKLKKYIWKEHQAASVYWFIESLYGISVELLPVYGVSSPGGELVGLFDRLNYTDRQEYLELTRDFYTNPEYEYGLYALFKWRRENLDSMYSNFDLYGQSFGINVFSLTKHLMEMDSKHLSMEKMLTAISEICSCVHSSIPVSFFKNYYDLQFTCVEELVSGLTEFCTLTFRKHSTAVYLKTSAIENLINDSVNYLPGLTLFDSNLYQFILVTIKLRIQSGADSGSIRKALSTLWKKTNPSFEDSIMALWPDPLPINLIDLALFYQVSDDNMLFPNVKVKDRYTQQLKRLIEMAPTVTALPVIEQLLIKNIKIADHHFMLFLINQWVEIQQDKYGQDDGSIHYSLKITPVLHTIFKNFPKTYQKTACDILLKSICAQERISKLVAMEIQPSLYDTEKKQKSHKLLIFGLIEFSRMIAKYELELEVISFLTKALTDGSIKDFQNFLGQKVSEYDRNQGLNIRDNYNNSKEMQEIQIINIYHQFWDASIDQKALIMNALLMPANQVTTEEAETKSYQKSFDYIIDMLFPVDTTENRIVIALLRSYLNAAHSSVRPFLLAALICADKALSNKNKNPLEAPCDNSPGSLPLQDINDAPNSANDEDNMVVEENKFKRNVNLPNIVVKVAEGLGAPGTKVGQAAHSYPRTPTEFREALKHLKSQTRIPNRWELWHILRQQLSVDTFNNIQQLKRKRLINHL